MSIPRANDLPSFSRLSYRFSPPFREAMLLWVRHAVPVSTVGASSKKLGKLHRAGRVVILHIFQHPFII